MLRLVLIVAAILLIVIAAAYLYLRMPGRSFRGAPAPLAAPEIALRDGLRRDVTAIAFERHVLIPENYAKAAAFIERSLRDAGYETKRQTFVVEGVTCANIEAEVRGTSDEIVVVGAHYDTVDESPGADDNGSGVAAMLALARHFAHAKPKRTIRFVAFANEEPPYFMTEQMGSFAYARRAHERRENIVAMLSLEAIGVYSDTPHSQEYPAGLANFFPSTANFIAFASNVGSGALLRRCIATFRASATIPSEGAALPEDVPGVAWSDQWSFWRHGYRAVMVTGTALYRNPRYHTANDTPDTLDYDRLARVTEGLVAVITDLANGEP